MTILKKQKVFLLLFSIIFLSVGLCGCFEPKMKFLKEFGSENKASNEFSGPTDIAVNSKGEIYICDTGNNRVVVYNSNYDYIKTLSGGTVSMKAPYGIGIDTADNVYVADTENNRVIKYNSSGHIVLEIASTVKMGQQKDPSNSVKRPYDVAVFGDKQIFVVDSMNRLLVFEQTGVCANKLGSKGSGSDSFDVPARITVTIPNENERSYYFYISDSFNSRITKFNSEFKPVYEIKDKGVMDFLRDPRGLAILPDKSVIATDCGATPICAYSSSGVFEGSGGSFGTGRGKILSTAGVAVDITRKRVYVTDQLQNKVLVFSLHKEDFKAKAGEEK